MVRWASSTLNAVPGTVNGSRTVASAAARKLWSFAGAPVRTASASRARHGIVPTPPSARRAVAMVPSLTLSAAAAEAIANS